MWPKTVPRKVMTIKWVSHRLYVWHLSWNNGKYQTICTRKREKIYRKIKKAGSEKNSGGTLLPSSIESCCLRVDQMA